MKNVDKKVTWYQDDQSVYDAMIDMQLKEEKRMPAHLPPVLEIINEISKDCKSILDVGCGAGAISRYLNKFDYTGCDLQNIVENVAKKYLPEQQFVVCDFYNDDLAFVKNYDLVFMNAFLDVSQYPVDILKKVLENSSKYVLIHRQLITDEDTVTQKEHSYGGTLSYRTFINKGEFGTVIKEANFEIVKGLNLPGDYGVTILLKKEDS
jgi:SAM-dependent methyltransferase